MRFIETSLYEVSINMWALEKMSPSHFFIWITLCDKHNNNRQKIISALRAALFACSVTLPKYACYWNTRLLSIVPFLSPQAASTSMTSYGKLLGYCSIMYMWNINVGLFQEIQAQITVHLEDAWWLTDWSPDVCVTSHRSPSMSSTGAASSHSTEKRIHDVRMSVDNKHNI